jgi:hypothetical protein
MASFKGLQSKGKLLKMAANTRLDRKGLTGPNTLAYHCIILFLLIEDFVVKAPCVIVIGGFSSSLRVV